MSQSMMVTITPQRRIDDDRSIGQRAKLTVVLLFLEMTFVALFGVFLRYADVAMPYDMRHSGGGVYGNSTESTTQSGITVPGVNDTNFTTVSTTPSTTTFTTSAPTTATTMAPVVSGCCNQVASPQALHTQAAAQHVNDYYPIFEDIHVMMFVGFGFLGTYLYRYGLGNLSYNFVLGAMCIQWATLTSGWIRKLKDQNQSKHDYYNHVDLTTMLDADYAVASVLVAMGAVLGKASLLQMVVMAFCQVAAYQANCLMIYDLLAANDPGYSMTVHVFGAYFGLIVARIIQRKETIHEDSKRGGSIYHSDMFAMIGTLFLWTLYPSFNSAFAKDEGRIRAIINTYYALTASVMTTFALTHLFNKERFDMMHVQNATIAGGVAVGTVAQMMIQPWGAVLTGFVAGIVSTLGFQYMQPCMKRIGVHDTCGVQYLHGFPGLISAFGSILAGGVATYHRYWDNEDALDDIFKHDRTLGQKAGYQAAALAVTLGTSIIAGILTGTLMKLPIWDQPRYDDILDDEPRFVTVTDIPGQSYKIREDIIASSSGSKPSVAVTEFTTKEVD